MLGRFGSRFDVSARALTFGLCFDVSAQGWTFWLALGHLACVEKNIFHPPNFLQFLSSRASAPFTGRDAKTHLKRWNPFHIVVTGELPLAVQRMITRRNERI